MRRFLAPFLLVVLCAGPLRPAFARATVADLVQPVLVEIDERLAALAQATLPAEVKLRTKLQIARAVLASAGGEVNDVAALKSLKSFAAKLEKALPSDPDFATILDTALDGADKVAVVVRADIAARIDGLADPAAAAKAAKGLAKLDVLIAASKAPALVGAARAKALGSAFARALLVEKSLLKCPGTPGAQGHGQFTATVDGVLFAPKFAAATLYVSGGNAVAVDLDGYRFPYENGTMNLQIPQNASGVATEVVYSRASNNLGGNYAIDGVSYFIETGTLTLTEVDVAKRRIAGAFSFTARDFVSGNSVVVESGSFVICDFRVTAP